MIHLSHKLNTLRVTLGGVILALATGILTFAPSLQQACAVAFACGVIVTISGFVQVSLMVRFYHQWNSSVLHRALSKAPPDATIRILQTWMPDRETFLPRLEELLTTEGKRFHFKILLVSDTDMPDVLGARVRFRPESRREAADQVRSTIDQLKQMTQRVNQAWKSQHNGARLDLTIHSYSFMPFGPIYHIGDSMFVGIYPNHCSSAHGPMIVVKQNSSRCWDLFDLHLTTALKASPQVFPAEG